MNLHPLLRKCISYTANFSLNLYRFSTRACGQIPIRLRCEPLSGLALLYVL